MKKFISLLFAALLLVTMAGCSSNNYENGEVQIFLPGEYINPDVVSAFEDEYHVKCNLTLFDSNENMYTKLLGTATWDIVIPSDYMIERLIKEELVQKLDKSKLDCLDDLYDGVLNMSFDPNNDYSIPYFWGNTGIVYDADIVDQKDVEAEGWAVLKNPKYAGQVYMYDSVRDMFMIAEKDLGYDMNTSDPSELEDAYNWLCEMAELSPEVAGDECIDGLATGEKAMGFMYSGDAATIIANSELNMHFYTPANQGVNYFVDSMMILKDAKNIDNAYKFINYITSYDGAYENGVYVGYCSVNKDVIVDLSSEGGDFEENEAYLPREMNDKDDTFHNDEKTLKIINEYFIKVKNKAGAGE